MSEILWQPTAEQAARSRMRRFLDGVNAKFRLQLSNYQELHSWSVRNIASFWEFFAATADIRFHHPPARILSSTTMPGAHWFEGAQLNFTENLLRGGDDKLAIIAGCEHRQQRRTLTYGQLRIEVERFAGALRAAGIRPGDRVAGYLPNIPEAVIAYLGSAAIGAVWSSCSPDFGRQGVLDRFGQIAPRILVSADGYSYNGKRYPLAAALAAIAGQISSLEHVIIVPFLEETLSADFRRLANAQCWTEFLAGAGAGPFCHEAFPFEHPLCILYSSGTTGLPKSIVHGAGGVLLQHFKEHALHTGIGASDTVFYYTTCGWMMWNWLVSALAQSATIVLYEGSPLHPNPAALWELAAECGITVFGTSPRFISTFQKSATPPRHLADLGALRTILSTGSPLEPDAFRWVYTHVKENVQLSSISGGTDIISCFMLGNPMLPVIAGEIQCLGLGMDVVAMDGSGQPVTGRKGELVCRSPAPSMPIYFWNDPGNTLYRRAYFHHGSNLWLHGDFIEIKAHGGVVVYGRSDATLNPGGVRIGAAEIYRVVEALPEIEDSLVIGVEADGDIKIILFIVPRAPATLDEPLRQRIKSALRQEASPRHVPHAIYTVSEIPRTLNGKKVEIPVRDFFHGQPLQNINSLANPAVLDELAALKADFFARNVAGAKIKKT